MVERRLRTERLLLVPLADRHLDLEVGLDADPEVHRYLTGRAQTAAETAAAHAHRLARATQLPGLGFWTAFTGGCGPPADEGAGEFVGLMMLPPVATPERFPGEAVAELGYRLLRRFWRQGLAGEASRALLDHAFGTAGQDRVVADTMAVNTASRATMRSLGMRHVRTFWPDVDEPLPGAEFGDVEYEITAREWRTW
ncbi:GNAT family N-acetyltransferase [Pseudonocardia phyllosphaerae]|uniref:GNAT family N-acetyltransferase n=1 Tax=Pseudonocardia phyllosphaerae TaxID=3390502 RepID=UPI00397D6EDB